MENKDLISNNLSIYLCDEARDALVAIAKSKNMPRHRVAQEMLYKAIKRGMERMGELNNEYKIQKQ